MIILAIDPGTRTSGVVIYHVGARRVLWSNKAMENLSVLDAMRRGYVYDENQYTWDHVGVERVQASGMGGNDIIITTEWSARFLERAFVGCQRPPVWHHRREVLRHLDISGGKGNKDSKVRARCIELHGGDRKTAQGTKKAPGPLYGVASHSWQALGLALLVADI